MNKKRFISIVHDVGDMALQALKEKLPCNAEILNEFITKLGNGKYYAEICYYGDSVWGTLG